MEKQLANTIRGCTDCQRLQYGFDIIVVDEQNTPLDNIPYTLTVSNIERRGVTDRHGHILEMDLKPGPAKLVFDSDKLATSLLEERRQLRVNRDPLTSPVRDDALREQRDYHYVRIGEVIDRLPTVAGWEAGKRLPDYHFPDQQPQGMALFYRSSVAENTQAAQHIRKITLEVCPLRVWVLLLEYTTEYRLNNAYNCALLSMLVYAAREWDEHGSPLGSIDHFFGKVLPDVSQLPSKVNDTFLPILVQDVPLTQGYLWWEMLDTTEEPYKRGDTQCFYAYSTTQALIAWRGTAGSADIQTDINATPVGSIIRDSHGQSKGKMHLGFRQAYEIGDHFFKDKKTIFQSFEDKQVFICGHSLGGALALINAVDWYTLRPLLYTYGMPRVFDQAALTESEWFAFCHFRHVNDRDPVPSVPMQGLPNVNSLRMITLLATFFDPKLSQFMNEEDLYAHHGQLVYFVPTVGIELGKAVLKRGGVLTYKQCFYSKSLLVVDEQLGSPENRFEAIYRQLALYNDNPDRLPVWIADHSMRQYSGYLYQRLLSQLSEGTEKEDIAHHHMQTRQFMKRLESQLQNKHFVDENRLAELIVLLDQQTMANAFVKSDYEWSYQRFFLAVEVMPAQQKSDKQNVAKLLEINREKDDKHLVKQYIRAANMNERRARLLALIESDPAAVIRQWDEYDKLRDVIKKQQAYLKSN